MTRKPGYAYLLTLTKILTLVALVFAVSTAAPSIVPPLRSTGLYMKLGCMFVLLFMAGSTCIVRKRFLTEQ